MESQRNKWAGMAQSPETLYTKVVKLDAIARGMSDAKFLAWIREWMPPNAYARIEARFEGHILDCNRNYAEPDPQTEDCPE